MSAPFITKDEEIFASILDAHGIVWEYEPHLIIFSLNERGLSSSGFNPDFYLPRWHLHVEISSDGAAAKRKKKRKVRKSVDQFPWIRIRIIGPEDLSLIAEDSSFEWLETVILDGFTREPLIDGPELNLPDDDVWGIFNNLKQSKLDGKETGDYQPTEYYNRELLQRGWDIINRADTLPHLVRAFLTPEQLEELSNLRLLYQQPRPSVSE